MNFKKFIEMYDNWNGTIKINDDNLETIIKGKIIDIVENHCTVFIARDCINLLEMKVIAFGFYDNELCVRVI